MLYLLNLFVFCVVTLHRVSQFRTFLNLKTFYFLYNSISFINSIHINLYSNKSCQISLVYILFVL